MVGLVDIPYLIRMGSANVPVGIRHKIVQIHSRTTDMQTIVAVAADNRTGTPAQA